MSEYFGGGSGGGGGGSGTFSGPGSSTAHNLIAFADTTGALGEDSGLLTSTVITTTNTKTLTNKTLTAPIIGTISNTGTLTLPTSTDTLVGRATTDTLSNKTLAAAVVTTSLKLGNYHIEPSFSDAGNSGSSITLDLSTASVIKTTFNAATPALTLSNGVAGGFYMLMFVQDGTGSRVPSFVTTIDWGVNGAPTFSTGAGKVDFVNLFTPDGSTFYGLSYVLGY